MKMKDLLWAELAKLRRSKMVLIAAFATVMVAAIVFAEGQFAYRGTRYIEGAGWYMTAAQSLATFFVLPAIIALLGSYMILREDQDDTKKALLLIPVSESGLILSKLLVSLALSALSYLLLFLIAFAVEAALHMRALTAGMALGFLKTYLLDGLGVFLAISPVIALVARLGRGYWLALIFAEISSFAGLFASMSDLKALYPITAVFCVSGYYSASPGERAASLAVLLLCGGLALLILRGLAGCRARPSGRARWRA